MKKYIVEFWPGRRYEIEAMGEKEALLGVVKKFQDWPGGTEYNSGGVEFKAWVFESGKEA